MRASTVVRLLLIVSALPVLAAPAYAQAPATPPAQSSVQSPTQNSAGGPPPPSIPGSGAPGTPSPGVTTSAPALLAPATGVVPAASATIFYAPPPIGRGFPGMPGGPPLNTPLGAQDPAGSYMRPPILGPLVCDPATLEACE